MTPSQFPSHGTVTVVSHTTVAQGYKRMELQYANPVPQPEAGQFFTLASPLPAFTPLRRPFAYAETFPNGFSFIYELRGQVTQAIAQWPVGTQSDVIGPLGTPFPLPTEQRKPILVAGGIGVGPIYALAHTLCKNGYAPIVSLGSREAALIPDLDWPASADVRICTDDGSKGIHGNALAALQPDESKDAEFYSCGPHPMMKAVYQLAQKNDAPSWSSLEEMMACGVGACQGCAIPMEDGGYERACVEGPVFDSRRLAW
ncbi:MAG: dihydroorotate dehydrogenase electron transfer subunit [Spirochaetales bacterium]|nr:dihydroorotate dehydrogenase electron transfer subunit [Spirochaetales bacterium]